MRTLLEIDPRITSLHQRAGRFSIFNASLAPERTPTQRAMAIVLRLLMLARADGKGTHRFDYETLPNPQH